MGALNKEKRSNNVYRSEIVFDDEIESIFIDGSLKKLEKADELFDRGMFMNSEIKSKFGTPAWENEMINNTLDIFRGTDWKHVTEMNY